MPSSNAAHILHEIFHSQSPQFGWHAPASVHHRRSPTPAHDTPSSNRSALVHPSWHLVHATHGVVQAMSG